MSSVAPDEARDGPRQAPPAEAPSAAEPAETAVDRTTVVIRFRPELITTWLQTGSAPAVLTQLGDVLTEYGFRLTQTHRGTDDPGMASWFSFGTSETEARRALALLQRHPAVEAAYSKPPEGPPG